MPVKWGLRSKGGKLGHACEELATVENAGGPMEGVHVDEMSATWIIGVAKAYTFYGRLCCDHNMQAWERVDGVVYSMAGLVTLHE